MIPTSILRRVLAALPLVSTVWLRADVTLPAVSDAYVRDGTYASTNFGSATTLVVKKDNSSGFNRIGFLRFDLGSVGSANHAVLRLYGNYGPTNGSLAIDAYLVSPDSSSESTLTWSNQPAISTYQATTTVTATAQYWEWDVTAAVQSELAAGHSSVSIALKTATVTANFPSFNTKEAAANAPQLVVTPITVAPVFSPAAGTYVGSQSVTISSTTPGASIRYTTDGSAPTSSTGIIYSGPISIGSNTNLNAIAYAAGMTDSAVTGAAYVINPSATAAPTFSPGAGLYNNNQSVTLASATTGAMIRYTTDGSTPTPTTGILYTGPVTINGGCTLNAIAYASGYTDSTTSSAAYSFQVTDPLLSVAGGTYTSVQTVTLSSATSGATIRYTLDGTTPNLTTSPFYTGPISILNSATLNVLAYRSGFASSNVVSASYTLNVTPCDAPIFSLAAGTYTGLQTVTITCPTTGATICYTVNGTTPTVATTTLYTGPVTIGSTATLSAMAYKTGTVDTFTTTKIPYAASSVTTAGYVINLAVAAPAFSPAGGVYANNPAVTISTSTSGTTIRYTTDGSAPSETNGTVYTGPVTVSASSVLKAIAYDASHNVSPIAADTFTLQAETPSFGPDGGIYSSPAVVTITSGTSGRTIRYTTNGSVPTTTNGNFYTGPVTIGATATLQAIAYKTGYSSSLVASDDYIINAAVATPVFSPLGGTFTGPHDVSISTSTTGASIRYTTDGSLPTSTTGVLYTGPVTVSTTSTLTAIAYKSGLADSSTATAAFTINPITSEAESMSPTGSVTPTNNNDASASGGVWVLEQSTATGQFIQFTTPSIVAGTYQLQLRYKANNTRAQHSVSVDSVPLGGTVDQYGAINYLVANIGIVSFSTDGTHVIRLAVTGKNASSTNYQISADSFSFVPQATSGIQVATPTFSPASGTYTSAQTVTISTATSGASIRYTSDGSLPTSSTGTLYSGPVTIGVTTTLNAIASKGGLADSAVSGAQYNINYSFPPGVAILVDAAESGAIQKAIVDLQRDLKKVLGVDSLVTNSAAAITGVPAIVVTCSGSSTAGFRDPLLVGFENHALMAQGALSAPRIVLQGSDPRGTVYAIYEFSDRFLDIPPLWYWASWQAQAKSAVAVPSDANLRFGTPAVHTRAWFPNDTDLLSPWMLSSPNNFAAVFESLLRLKYNTLDVGSMHDFPSANHGLSWARECKARGITITFTHLAPFGADPADWNGYWTQVRNQGPPLRSLADQQSLDEFWTYFINLSQREGFTDVIQSLAFRGHGDNGFWVDFADAPTTDANRAAVVSGQLNHQLSLLKTVTGNLNPPMRTVFYNEVSTYMANGLLTPPVDGQNLIWNFAAQQRDHYPFTDVMNYNYTAHSSLPVGYYMSANFYSTGSHLCEGEGPWKIEDNLRTASTQAGPGNFNFAVLNVGNIREFPVELAATADLLWNFGTYDSDTFIQAYCARYFGKTQGPQVAGLYMDLYEAYWPQKASDFSGGFARQYIFQDLRYARAAEDILTNLENRSYTANPLGTRGPSFYRISAVDNGATNDLGAVLMGTGDSINLLTPLVASCDALYPNLPASGQALFNDAVRQQAHFLLQANLFLKALDQALSAVPSSDTAVLPHLYEAETAIVAMQAALDQRTQGTVYGSWYSHDTKFGVQALKNRVVNAIRQYGGTP